VDAVESEGLKFKRSNALNILINGYETTGITGLWHPKPQRLGREPIKAWPLKNGRECSLAETKSKLQEFLIILRDLCIVVVLGIALAAGGYLLGKSNGRSQELAKRSSTTGFSQSSSTARAQRTKEQ